MICPARRSDSGAGSTSAEVDSGSAEGVPIVVSFCIAVFSSYVSDNPTLIVSPLCFFLALTMFHDSQLSCFGKKSVVRVILPGSAAAEAAAVDMISLTGHVAGGVGGQQDCHSYQLIRRAGTFHGNAFP